MSQQVPFGIVTPCSVKEQREMLVMNDICPECSGELNTGWECNSCKYDAQKEVESLYGRQEDNG